MRKPRVPFSAEIAWRIWRGLNEGQGLRRLCRQPGMPTRATVMRWLRERPDFAATAQALRRMGGLDGVGLPSGFRNGIGDVILDRLVAGEPLRTICRDPDMPSRSTVHTWMRLNPEWAQAMACARDLASWAAADAQMSAWGYADGIANFPLVQTPRSPVLPGS